MMVLFQFVVWVSDTVFFVLRTIADCGAYRVKRYRVTQDGNLSLGVP